MTFPWNPFAEVPESVRHLVRPSDKEIERQRLAGRYTTPAPKPAAQIVIEKRDTGRVRRMASI